jgi:cytochrome c oxidase subunit IV
VTTRNAQIHWIRPCTRVWLLLMALSCVTYLVGASAIDALWAALLVLGSCSRASSSATSTWGCAG